MVCDNANCISRGFDVDGYGIGGANTIKTHWRALSAISAESATVTVQIMCMKMEGVS